MNLKKELTPLEKWNRLTLADNFIFCKVMEDNPDICKELLELLLNIKIERLEIPLSERTFKTDFDSRGIRFDVYVKDANGRSFDIEIQTTHSTTLSKRARYYQGLMDVDNLHSGSDFSALKESYVIFLCLGDAFGKNLPVYTFEYTCKEDSKIKMNDGTTNIFFNAKNYDKMKSEELKAFFKYLCGKEPSSCYTDKLSAIVERAKHNAQWRHRFMTWEQEMKYQSEMRAQELAKDIAKDMAEDMAKDMAKDMANENTINTAKRFIEMGITPEKIAKGTGLSLNTVLELQKEIET